ncbi:hypothetical protein A8B98_17915 [Hymenobacter sp. UV11]|nr:hypothetical protein A8B98_17915 [Hymenobacter sp. UV11]
MPDFSTLAWSSFVGAGHFRRELLNAYLFTSLRQVREQCQSWQYDYNHLRPHEALNFLTPIEFRQAA